MVGGQSAGLVRANDAAAAQGLNRRKTSHNSVLGGHLAGSQGKAGSNDNRKTLRNGRNTERDGNLEVVDGTLGPVSMARVGKVGDVDEPDKNANDSDNLGELVSEVIELLLQGGRLRDLCGNALVDVADSSVRTSQDNDGSGVTSDNSCTRKQHIDLILQDRLVVANDGLEIFPDAFAFSGQDSLVHGKAVAFDRDQSAVSRDAGTNGNVNDIAWHKILSLDTGNLSIAHHVGLVGRIFLQSGNCLLGTAFLGHSNNGVENKDCQDDSGVDEGTPATLLLEKREYERDGGRAQEDENQLVLELFQDKLPDRCRRFLGDG